MTFIDKEEQRKKILESNSSLVKDLDYSMFGDDDPDVFAKLVRFDSYKHNIYPTLSEVLKNNKEVATNAAKCSSNIPFLPDYFFQDKDIIKNIIYDRSEKHIPLKHLTKDVINYMFVTCSRSSMATEDIKKACDEHLTKESIIKVLLHQNNFYSDSKKRNAHPCIDDIYIPAHFLEDKDVLQLLIIPQFKIINGNENITKEMIIELLDSGYVLQQLPKQFLNDIDFIKRCLTYKDNYHFFDDYQITKTIELDQQLNLDYLAINPNIAGTQRYPLLFESFKELFAENLKTMHLCSKVVKRDKEKLFNFLTSEEALSFFESKDKNFENKYDFSVLYECDYYYWNPIPNNPFIIEAMAKQDKVLFSHITEDMVNDNSFMFKLLCEHKAVIDFEEQTVEALLSKIGHSDQFEKYVNMLQLEHSLSSKFTKKNPEKKKKI